MNLSTNTRYREGAATTAAGTTTINGAEMDMAGYEGVLWICKFGTAATDNQIKAQQDTVTGMAGAQDLLGTLVTVGASDEIVWLDLYRPLERFVRVVVLRGTSTTIDWCIAIRYGSMKGPQDNTVAGTIAGELHTGPAEGTA